MRDRNNRRAVSLLNFKLLALSIALGGSVILILGGLYWDQLPPRLAIHFSFEGTPNGWMDKWVYLVTMTLITLVIPASYFAAFVHASNSDLVRNTTAGSSMQRGFAKRVVMTFAALELELLVLHQLVILQNLSDAIKISVAGWGVLIVAMLATQLYAVHLLVKLNRTPDGP